MDSRTVRRIAFVLCIAALSLFVSWDAGAVPSFQRQTGLSCTVCHTVFPELTAFGRSFKLGGFVLTKSGKQEQWVPPIAAMVQASYTDQKGLSNRIDPFDDSPDAKTNVPQQASLFYGGKIIDHVGALAQLTYDGVGNNLFLDNTDVRYANALKLGDTNLMYGVTVNNNPTVQDVWNTVPAWRFPSASSAVALTPAARPIIDGLLAQQVGGIGVYGFWNNLLYAEASVYRTTRKGITRPLGAGTTTTTVTDGAVPYGRLALSQQWDKHSVSLGGYGVVADVFPGDATSGPTDRVIDTGADAQYQYVSKNHVFSAQANYTYEKQLYDANFDLGNTANRVDFLSTFRTNLNYWYRASFGTIGGTVGYFSTNGRRDEVLYAPAETTGSRTGLPDSRGYIVQADFLPWEKWKFSLQYTMYTRFNGAKSDYDGSGTDAKDNNTLYFLVWMAF